MEPPPSQPAGLGDLLRAQHLLGLGQSASALRWAEEALASQPGWVAAQLVRAQALLQLERFEEASQAAQQALALAPEDAHACRLRALALLSVGSRRECLRVAEEACRLEPESPLAVQVRVEAELLNDLTVRARLSADRLLELAPHQHWAHDTAGRVALACRAWREAEAHFRRGLELHPECPAALNNLALCLEREGRLDEALEMLHRAVRLAPTGALPRFNLRRVIARRALRRIRPYLLAAGPWMAWLLVTRRTTWLAWPPATVELIDLAWLVVLVALLALAFLRLLREQRRLHPELQAFEKAAERRSWPDLALAAGSCLLLAAGLAALDEKLRALSLDFLTYYLCVALIFQGGAWAASALRDSARRGRPRWPPHLQILLLAPLLTIWHKLIEPPQRQPLGWRGLMLLALPGLALLGLGLALKRRRQP